MDHSLQLVTWTLLIWALLALRVTGGAPTITVSPPNPHYVKIGEDWSDPGVNCTDPEEGYLDVVMTPAFVSTSAAGTFNLMYTCTDNNDYPWHTVRDYRTVIVRGVPSIHISGAASITISRGAFGPMENGFCRSTTSGNQQSNGLVALDTINTAFSKDRQAKCLALCRYYQWQGTTDSRLVGKGCELRVTGATNPGCYIHTEVITRDGADTANYYCWKAEFNDPGACCTDFEGNALPVLKTSYPLTRAPGDFQISYWCEDTIIVEQVFATRDVHVDRPPEVSMVGDQYLKVTRGSPYTEFGVLCTDAEDGIITELPLGGSSDLRIASTTSSGFGGGAVNHFATVDNLVTAGAYTGSGTPCEQCHVTAADGGVHWVKLDLGHVRIVHKVKMHKTVGAWTIKVGTSEVRSRNPICGTAPNEAGWQTTTCGGPLAGRYVHIEDGNQMTICEVKLQGQPGPPPPSSFDIIGGCGALEGTYELNNIAEGWPIWTNSGNGILMYDTTGFVLKYGTTEYARASEGASLPAAQWVAVTAGCVPLIQFTPADACTWLYGFSSQSNSYKCADGTQQATIVDCLSRGGLAQCPPNLPQMCAILDVDPANAEGCATDCSISGMGTRACGKNGKTGMDEFLPFFTFAWAGNRNDATGEFGISFTPKTNIYVTHLGRQQGAGVTLSQTVTVTLWSTLTQQAVAVADVGPSSVVEGSYRMQALANPVMITGGTEYRLTQQCTNGMSDLWNDATGTIGDYWAATEWPYITISGGVSLSGSHGYPSTTDAPLQRMGMVNFNFIAPTARVDVVGKVNSSFAGTTNLVYTCVDTLGQRTTAVRNVEVGCEGPNPTGIYGGNKIPCEVVIESSTLANFAECTQYCLADAECEACEFFTDTSICSKLRRCTGKYERDYNIYRQCGVCKVVDNPPIVVLAPAAETVNKDGSWAPGAIWCNDNEDQVPPTPVQLDVFSSAVAGVFAIRYSCTDTLGQTAVDNYTVTVKDDCSTDHFNDPNGHPAAPCSNFPGQSAPVLKHGESCVAQCGDGWVAVDDIIYCLSNGRYDYQSHLELHDTQVAGVQKDYECGEQPCFAPNVAFVKNDFAGVAMACQQGHRIVNDAICTPNCMDGYIPNIVSLECDLGTFIPATFICRLPAAPPVFIAFGLPDVLDVAVQWEGGAPNDCGFLQWKIEARQTIRGFTEAAIIPPNEQWHTVIGCGSVNHTVRSTVFCHAFYKIEGATYEFRVREECTVDDMTSPWKISNPVKMRIVIPPEVLFTIPSSDVTFDPVQLMVAYTVPIRLTDHDAWGNPADIRVNISRVGEWCIDSTGGFGGMDYFSVSGAEIIEAGGTNSYVRLTGARIVIIKPPDLWIQPGCDFNVTLEEGALQTVDIPSKPIPWSQFNFTHIDLPPEFKQFVMVQKTTVTVEFKIQWDLLTVMNCTLFPTNENCPNEPNNPGCVIHELEIKEQVSLNELVTYFRVGLYPGTEYRTLCGGYKFGKPWIPVVPIPVERYPEVTWSTLQDTDASIQYFYMNVTVVCDPVHHPDVGIHLPLRFKSMMPPEFVMGYTVQILDWRDTCVDGRQMEHNEQARMTVVAETKATSIFAVVRWIVEPQADDVLVTTHHFDYVKDVNSNADPIVFTFWFQICPLAAVLVPNGPVQCTNYQIVVQCVDISFSFDYFTVDDNIDGGYFYYNYQHRRLLNSGEEEETATTMTTVTTTTSSTTCITKVVWSSGRNISVLEDSTLNHRKEVPGSGFQDSQVFLHEDHSMSLIASNTLNRSREAMEPPVDDSWKRAPDPHTAQQNVSRFFLEKLPDFVAPAQERPSNSEQATLLLGSLFDIVDTAHKEVHSGKSESMEEALKGLMPDGPLAPGGQARRLQASDLTVAVGTGAILQCNVSRATFDWTTITIHAGPIRGIHGFRQFLTPTGEDDFNEDLALVLLGQGTRLPMCLEWEAVTFPTPFYLSFTPPNLTVPEYEARLDISTILVVNLGNVPNVSTLINATSPQIYQQGDTGTGYGNPANHIQIGVYKEGRDENLCGTLVFPNIHDWTTAECMLLPAALLNITVEIRLKDFIDAAFYRVPSTIVRGQVTYKLPTHIGIKDAGDWALNPDNTISLAMVSQRQEAVLFPEGDKLPSLAVVQLGGATLPGYEMRIQGDQEINMCESIEWINASYLRCPLRRCLNITGLLEMPGLLMYLGDLRAMSAVPGTLKVPRPIVDSFSPNIIDDVGRNRTLTFWGRHFGELFCKDEHVDSVQFLGSPTGAHITVGEYEAPCRIVFQNDTRIECMVSDPVSDPREPTYVGPLLPPPRRTTMQVITLRKGNYLTAKNMDQMATRRGGRLLEEDDDEVEIPQRRLQQDYIRIELTVRLMDCPAGWRRKRLDLDECEPCSKGRYNTELSDEWPLLCHVCEEGTYADEEGSTECKTCPTNTFAAQPASSVEACLCKPGFYSQYYNESTGQTQGGTACLSCSSFLMTDEPYGRKETCGGTLPVAMYCDVKDEANCAPEKIGTMYYRVCKAYCAGGTSWPVPKWTFTELELRQISGPGSEWPGADLEGPVLFEPQLARCDPPVACMNAGVCHYKYTGYGCGECVFGYYRDKYSKECVPCGEEQVIGMIIMAGVCVMMSFGGLFFSSTFMRIKSDIVFERELKLAFKEFVVEPLCKSKGLAAVFSARERRVMIILNKWEVGSSFRFAKTGHLGMVFRVSEKGVIHIAGILPQSPLSHKVKPGWKLISVNGVRPRAKAETEVHALIQKTRFPLRFVFRLPHGGEGDGTLAFEDLDNDRKMIVMLIGVMNAFNQISMFDFEWPPIFRYLAALAAQFAFSFNFFHPECSVPTPFNTKWMGMLAIPYFMVLPLTTAYIITRSLSTPFLRDVPLKVRKWLLRNAFARTMCMSIILLFPFHLEQLLIPFACVERAEGTYFVSATPDTLCSFKDPRFGQMLMIGCCGGSVMLAFYSLLIWMLQKTYYWQFGNQVRDEIPFYAGMVQVSVFGQLGYIPETRWRVMLNVASCNLFDPGSKMLRKREFMDLAVDELGPRTRKAQQAKVEKIFAEAGKKRKKGNDQEQDEAEGEAKIGDEETAAAGRQALKKGIKRWKRSKFLAPRLREGNVVTFGWILIVNLFWRQLFSLMTIKMSEGNLVVVGAAAQMVIYGGNVTMLIAFHPYSSAKVGNIECTMLSALFMVLWCAVIKDLLSNHVNAHLFADTLQKVNNAIDVMAIVLMSLVVVMPSSVVYEMIAKVLGSMQSKDSLLNEIYFTQTLRLEREATEKFRMQMAKEDELDEGGLVVPRIVGIRYPAVKEAVRRLNNEGAAATPEQRRQFVHFMQIARSLPWQQVKASDRLKDTVKDVIQENTLVNILGKAKAEERAKAEDAEGLEKGVKCPKGHRLDEFVTPDDEWSCHECAIPCPTGTHIHRCFRCNYNLCAKCKDDCEVGGRCKKGHIIVVWRKVPWHSAKFTCLGCKTSNEGDRWTCMEGCAEDYCFNCRPDATDEVASSPDTLPPVPPPRASKAPTGASWPARQTTRDWENEFGQPDGDRRVVNETTGLLSAQGRSTDTE